MRKILVIIFAIGVFRKFTITFQSVGAFSKQYAKIPILVDYRFQLQKYEPLNNNCTFTGLICEDCNTVAHCIEQPDGNYQKEIVAMCKSNRYCFDGICTKYVPSCDGSANLQFPCSSVGIYPDPYFCDKFHFCIPGASVGVVAKCEPGYAYNVKTTSCDMPIYRAQHCYHNGNYPVPLCMQEGQSEALDNLKLYYICISYKKFLYPFLHLCPIGMKYDTTDFTCK